MPMGIFNTVALQINSVQHRLFAFNVNDATLSITFILIPADDLALIHCC